ncbi:hypothetical protein SSP24_81130 [Streptomyces spinoverrucosus]|uniref:Uncharacterized protein n=1 Tax=Streptomyces spinoverrucosus TaxID=284043 RepID=A0A4Y3VW38_9ACTN|nr:hypothetical protein SSP24_81130 [Streptomyces spinoverrucosus]GHB91903.1 hypothetical protein GCM10010397_75500 [Streptomyces spinoverrucosus]
MDGFGAVDLNAEVVHAGRLARGAFDQDELERGIGDGEVGLAVAEFGGPGAEQLAVEGHGRVEIWDTEGQLYAGHGAPPAGKGGLAAQQPPEETVAPMPICRVAGAAQPPPSRGERPHRCCRARLCARRTPS